jgi:hypothetical protein
MRRWLALIFGGLALLIAGYRIAQSTSMIGTTTTVIAPNPSAYAPPTTTTSPATASTTTPAPRAPSYPVVAFNLTIKNPHAVWPFTAQLASITLDPNGFPASGAEPPQDTYLMVQVNITSQITGRTVPSPNLQSMILCHGPGDRAWSSLAEGYDEGAETAPSITGFNVAMGDGQPHPWDIEWVVPSSTPIAHVRCELGPDPNASFEGAPALVRVVGKRRLN